MVEAILGAKQGVRLGFGCRRQQPLADPGLTQLLGVQAWQQRLRSGRNQRREGMKTSTLCPDSENQAFI